MLRTRKFSELARAAVLAMAMQLLCVVAALLMVGTFASMCVYSRFSTGREDEMKVERAEMLRE